MEIIPSIIAKEFSEIKDKISHLEGLTNWVEIDVIDGLLASNLTWPFGLRQAPEDLKEIAGKIKIDAHLMIENPETVIEDWLDVADRLVVHYEATSDLDKIIELAGPHISLALALELETPVEKIYPYLNKIKLMQLMSISKIGFAGQPFDEHVLEKIKTLKADWPDVKIIVDGGINLEIGQRLKEAGADGLVVGSQIWQSSSVEEVVKSFQNL